MVTIEVLSIDGKIVRDFHTPTLLKGKHFSDLNLQGLASGQYLVVLKTSYSTSSTRLIIED
jgi:hypothetical protein